MLSLLPLSTFSATDTQDEKKEEKVDCHELKDPDGKKVLPTETYRADPEQVKKCILLGWDPPGIAGIPSSNWKPNGGKNASIKVGGSGGFSVGIIQAPETPAGQKKANASVTAAVIRTTCTFPPRVKVNTNGFQFPKGSCWDFFHDLLKDKLGGTNTSPPPPPTNDACPAESDTTGVFGTKSTVSGGASSTLPCGGMLPITSLEMVLNRNPTGLAITEAGSYSARFYRKTTSGYALVKQGPLPTYVCGLISLGDAQTLQKTVDLTPPIAQMITYDSSANNISIRLQSRATMDPNFVPPYNETEPERYLTIPIGTDGVPEVPAQASCPDESRYFLELAMKQDIIVRSSSEGCEKIGLPPTAKNDPKLECPGGGTPDANNKCFDSNGNPVAAIVKNNWSLTCPADTKTGQKIDPVDGVCPSSKGMTPPAGATGACINGKITYTATDENDPTKTIVKTEPCTAATPTTQAEACAAINAGVGSSCDMVEFPLDEASCKGKIQFGVISRPNLYYPPGSSITLLPVQSDPRKTLMAATANGTKMYANGQTDFFLQSTAPALIFNEGGKITLKNGSILIMEPPATINMSTQSVTLTGGGELSSSGGTQLQSFAPGASFAIPPSLIQLPLPVNVGRTATFPAGYDIMTMPTIGGELPYIRQPMTPPS